jgi:SAM-dependent methyltransferase
MNLENTEHVRAYNREAWDSQVESGNVWTVPFSDEIIKDARRGVWEILLTESKPVPRDWFPDLHGLDVLCLASGGGQQGPVLAAAGGQVTVFDNSPRQLDGDRTVAERHSLSLTTVEGDMRDLGAFENESFDLIFHPVSNIFVPDIRPVWNEAFRVLRHGGTMLAGIVNPVMYSFDQKLADDKGIFQVKHSLPYSDLTSITEVERSQIYPENSALEFGHTLYDQIGGQIDAGFLISGFYEDYRKDNPMTKYMPSYIATKATKP